MRGRFHWTAIALHGAALALAGVALAIVLPHLRGAELWQYDEWYTSERVQGIVAGGDWLTLYSNGEPVFKKPPLQYWTSALLRLGGMDQELALRLPSLLSALAVGWLTMRLAQRMAGGLPLAGLLALGLMLSSPLFWVSATSAMLDMPAALAVLAAVMATLRAWAAPRWWWAVALAVGFGALQKAPVAVPAVALVLAVLRLTDGPATRGKHALGAGLLALALLAIWPLAQWLISGGDALRIAFLQEQSRRFLPALMEDTARHIRWLGWVWQDGPLLWAGMIAATFALPFLRDGAGARAVLALMAVFLAALTAARGEVFDRYLVQILPFVSAAAGAALALLAAGRGRRAAGAAMALAAGLSLSAGGPVKPPGAAGLDRTGMAPFRPLLSDLRAAIRPDESLIVCGWGKSDLILFPGALWQLGSDDKPFRRIWRAEELREAMAIDNIRPPLRGLCLEEEFAALGTASPEVVEVSREAGFVHWVLRR